MSRVVEGLGMLAGGIGLFLLGITTMTNGLKVAAGPALEHILRRATRTPMAGLLSGILVTALVQSSSAVTVAVIGFVNAGLLQLGDALWVLFGANLGTTTTGWIVALLGLRVQIGTYALPLIGIGVALRLTGASQRRGALGDALAGFGLLFLGIGTLQQAFADIVTQYRLPQGEGVAAVLMQVAAGLVLTLLVQSSAATMTITLAAAQGGLLTTQGGAAVVIGANVGTTATALLASIGATPNARRAALAHVLFNVVAAIVATALLPWMVGFIVRVGDLMHLPHDPAITLALFHTSFSVLGLLLIAPVADRLTRGLKRLFRAREGDEGAPRYLDDTVAAVPELGVDALTHEVARIGAIGRRMLRIALVGANTKALEIERGNVERLCAAAQTFADRMNRQQMATDTSENLARVLRTLRYYESAAESTMQAAALAGAAADANLAERDAQFRRDALALLDHVEQAGPSGGDAAAEVAPTERVVAAMEDAYQTLKGRLLADGASGAIGIAAMEEGLRRYSALRRALQQEAKAHVQSLTFPD